MVLYRNTDVGLLFLRVAVGVTFLLHGIAKFQNTDATIGFFASLGLSSAFAYLVMTVEAVGGLAVLFGVWTDIAGVLLAIVMAYALLVVKMAAGKAFLGGYELDFVLLLSALALVLTGPGKYAVTRLWKKGY